MSYKKCSKLQAQLRRKKIVVWCPVRLWGVKPTPQGRNYISGYSVSFLKSNNLEIQEGYASKCQLWGNVIKETSSPPSKHLLESRRWVRWDRYSFPALHTIVCANNFILRQDSPGKIEYELHSESQRQNGNGNKSNDHHHMPSTCDTPLQWNRGMSVIKGCKARQGKIQRRGERSRTEWECIGLKSSYVKMNNTSVLECER